MYLKFIIVKFIKIMLLFLIFAVVMMLSNRDKKKKYGIIILASITPVIVEILKLQDFRFAFNDFAYGGYQLCMWVLMCFVYVLSFLMIYKATTNGVDSMIAIFKRDFKGWNIAVIVAIVLGICSVLGQTWYIIEYGDEYAQMLDDAINNANYLLFMTGQMKFNTLYDRLVDLNNILHWGIIACMIVPAVVHNGRANSIPENNVE